MSKVGTKTRDMIDADNMDAMLSRRYNLKFKLQSDVVTAFVEQKKKKQLSRELSIASLLNE